MTIRIAASPKRGAFRLSDIAAAIRGLAHHWRSCRGGALDLRRQIPNVRCRESDTIVAGLRQTTRTQIAPKSDSPYNTRALSLSDSAVPLPTFCVENP